ncbi:MAG: FtsX-like permease family protein, partial [Peptostreptococcaceae bacterium]
MGVKVLFKNTLNSFKKKKLQLLAIGIIIALSSFLYTTMFYAINSLKQPLENFIKETNQEDFSISMINGLTEFDINNLSDEYKKENQGILMYSLSDIKNYDLSLYNEIIDNRLEEFKNNYIEYELELREFKEVNFKNDNISNKITFFKDSENINLSFIEEGTKPKNDHEIAVTKIYAKKNNLNIGYIININNKKYTISGYVLFSDNTLPISNEDFIIDNSKITLGLVNKNEYEKIKGNENYYISGVGNEADLENFNKNVIKTYKDKEDLEFITSITLTKNQMRSGAIYEEIRGGEAMTIGISVIISTIAVLIVLIITYKIVKNEKTQIGVLKALGYTKNEILKPYIILLGIISLPMLLMGYIGGKYVAKYMKDFYLEFYLIPDGEIKTSIWVLFISIGIPLIVIIGLSSILINRMLKERAINLIKVSSSENVGKLNKRASKLLKNARPQTKFKCLFILSNSSKFFVFFIGIVFSSMLIIMSFMMSDFFDKMTLDYYKSVDYVYEGYVDSSKEYENLETNQEKFITLPNGVYKEDNVNVVGIEANSKLHKLFDKKDNDITNYLKQGVIVNKSFAISYDVDINDNIDVVINENKYQFKISNISKDYGANKVYINRSELSEIVTDGETVGNIESDEFYNGVYSIDKLKENKYLSVVNKENILEQSELMEGFIKIAIYSMILSSIFIAVIVLYVLTTMTVEDNY